MIIKCLNNGNYWQRSILFQGRYDVVCANHTGVPDPSDKNAHFLPIKIDDNTVVLKCLATGKFCDRADYDFLWPLSDSILGSCKMVLKEPVLSRRVTNVVYNIKKAEIFDSRVIALGKATAINSSSYPIKLDVTVKYSKTATKTWNTSVTVGASIKAKMSVGVPLVAKEGIEISASVSGTWGWGETSSETLERSGTFSVLNVPPGGKVMVTVSATEASCSVPFSYTQIDTLIDGKQRTNDFSDGIFNGANVFDVTWEAHDVTTGKFKCRNLAVSDKALDYTSW